MVTATPSSERSGNHEAGNPPGLSSGRFPRPHRELRLPHQIDCGQRANHHLGGRPYLSRRRRRDLLGEPPVLHGAGARPRHGRPGGEVPPPVWQQRQGRLTTSGSLCARDHGPSALEPGGPFAVAVSGLPTALTFTVTVEAAVFAVEGLSVTVSVAVYVPAEP